MTVIGSIMAKTEKLLHTLTRALKPYKTHQEGKKVVHHVLNFGDGANPILVDSY